MQILVLGNSVGEFNLSSDDWSPKIGVWTLKLDVYQNTGSVIEHEEVVTTIRAEGWNIGISQFDEIEQGGNGVLRIGISRTNYQIMTSPDCVISIIEGDGSGNASNGGWSISALIDVTATGFAPEIHLDRPAELTAGTEITATISCAAPWDVDDDADDDSSSLVLEKQTDIAEAVASWVWTGGVAVILLGILWKLNLLWPQEKSTIVRRRKGREKKPEQEVEVQIEATPESEHQDPTLHSPPAPEDMLTEPSMEVAPPTSIMAKYRTGAKSDGGSDIDSRIDRMLNRKEFD
jgi:hypothetical protein